MAQAGDVGRVRPPPLAHEAVAPNAASCPMLSVRQRSIEKKTGTNAMCKEVQFEVRTRIKARSLLIPHQNPTMPTSAVSARDHCSQPLTHAEVTVSAPCGSQGAVTAGGRGPHAGHDLDNVSGQYDLGLGPPLSIRPIGAWMMDPGPPRARLQLCPVPPLPPPTSPSITHTLRPANRRRSRTRASPSTGTMRRALAGAAAGPGGAKTWVRTRLAV